MKKPAIPGNETQRMACLLSTGLLDSPPEERFDRITRIAQHYFNVPITLVSLVDSERQWFKSKQGTNLQETPRDVSFCGHAILGDDVFLITDAQSDERFSDNPLVTGPPNIRFYAGMPLSGYDGSKIGTLCFVDTKPRDLTSDDIAAMRDLADCVEAELALIHAENTLGELEKSSSRMKTIIDALGDTDMTLNADGAISSISPPVADSLESAADEVLGKNIKTLL